MNAAKISWSNLLALTLSLSGFAIASSASGAGPDTNIPSMDEDSSQTVLKAMIAKRLDHLETRSVLARVLSNQQDINSLSPDEVRVLEGEIHALSVTSRELSEGHIM